MAILIDPITISLLKTATKQTQVATLMIDKYHTEDVTPDRVTCAHSAILSAICALEAARDSLTPVV